MNKFILFIAAVFIAETPLTRAADVKVNWGKICLNCHGPDGKGNTKLGRKAGVKDYTDPKVQSSFTDEKAFKTIKEGVREGDKERMKPFGDKLTDEEVKALVTYVRLFKK